MQNVLRNKLSELNNKRTPSKRPAANDESENMGRKLYQPPNKRIGLHSKEATEAKEKLNVNVGIGNDAGSGLAPSKSDNPPPFDEGILLLDFNFSQDFANKSWVEIIEEEEQKKAAETNTSDCDKPKQVESIKEELSVEIVSSLAKDNVAELKEGMSPSSASLSSTSSHPGVMPNPKKDWVEPAKGWCWDEKTLLRREKELQKMKDRPTYKRYLTEVPKLYRQKNVHPRTPNKYIAWSRRSWDQQVKIWKLAIYEWAGESPSPSVCSSYCASECSEEDSIKSSGPSTPKKIKIESKEGEDEKSRLDLLKNIRVSNPDTMASLLGHFDLDTIRDAHTLTGPADDESTLKAAPKHGNNEKGFSGKSYADAVVKGQPIPVMGPTDFSHLLSDVKSSKP